MLFGITPTPAALGSAVADPSGIDRCYSDLTLGIGVAPRRTTGGQVLVTKTRRQLGRTDERKDLLDHEPDGKTDQEDDREQRVHPCSPLERPSWPLESRAGARVVPDVESYFFKSLGISAATFGEPSGENAADGRGESPGVICERESNPVSA